MQLTNSQREGASTLFTSVRADQQEVLQALRWAHEHAGEIIDPHTAVGLHAALATTDDPATPMVTLATAHPSKFPDAVERATGLRPSLPSRVGDLFAREEVFTELPGDYDAVREFVTLHASSAT